MPSPRWGASPEARDDRGLHSALALPDLPLGLQRRSGRLSGWQQSVERPSTGPKTERSPPHPALWSKQERQAFTPRVFDPPRPLRHRGCGSGGWGCDGEGPNETPKAGDASPRGAMPLRGRRKDLGARGCRTRTLPSDVFSFQNDGETRGCRGTRRNIPSLLSSFMFRAATATSHRGKDFHERDCDFPLLPCDIPVHARSHNADLYTNSRPKCGSRPLPATSRVRLRHPYRTFSGRGAAPPIPSGPSHHETLPLVRRETATCISGLLAAFYSNISNRPVRNACELCALANEPSDQRKFSRPIGHGRTQKCRPRTLEQAMPSSYGGEYAKPHRI